MTTPAATVEKADGSPPAEVDARTDPSWVRPAVLALLTATAGLYLWGLSASGTANDFYAAAVQAGTKSWKAFFFGSFDASNFITVDKPPASLWVMEVSGRIFGFNSWSMLVPQALEGVASVWLLYSTVRRWRGPVTGLIAGIGLAVTPVAVLMFRFNNPDALLVLLCVAGAYAVVRAIEAASWRWLALAGALVGLGFLTKMLQAFLVVPAFGPAYLVAAPTSVGRRIAHLAASVGALVVSAGWWVAIVSWWPASSRPYIGGSTTNSVLNLAFAYNGLGRLTGNERAGGAAGPGGFVGRGGFGGGFPGRPGGGAAFGGSTGIARLFGPEMGTQISWLLPAALIGLVAGVWLTWRAPRTDRTRALLILFGTWLIGAGLVLSYMQGIVHPYYTLQIAPPIVALVAIAGIMLWHRRAAVVARTVLAAMVAVTAIWDVVLLHRTPAWQPWIPYAVLVTGATAVVWLLVPAGFGRRFRYAGAAAAAFAGLLGSGAYALATVSHPESGAQPTAGPAATAGGFGGGFGAERGRRVRPAGDPFGSGPVGSGPVGGLTDAPLVALLASTHTTWSAATVGSQSAAPLELQSGTAVMAIGGFSGTDPAPTLARFEAYVHAGDVRYFIGGAGGGSRGFGGSRGVGGTGFGGNSAIGSWVAANYASVTVGGQTVYDLSKPVS